MTKLRIMSDLHLEFSKGTMDIEPVGEDILVLSGDIGLNAMGAAWAIKYSNQHKIPSVMIAGNHEFYNSHNEINGPGPYRTMDQTLQSLHTIAENETYFDFINNQAVNIAGVNFLGCSLWTDYELEGDRFKNMYNAQRSMNDHRLIFRDEWVEFSPEDALLCHEFSRQWLIGSFEDEYKGPLVVMTHHLPSKRSIAGRYAGSEYNSCYASNLDDVVEKSGAAVWVHGHTHISNDYYIGETRIICNPRGYYNYETNPDFKPDLIVEI